MKQIRVHVRKEDADAIAIHSASVSGKALKAFCDHQADIPATLDEPAVFPVFVVCSGLEKRENVDLILDALPKGSLAFVVLDGDSNALQKLFVSHPVQPYFIETPKGQGIGRTQAQIEMIAHLLFP